MLSAPPLREKHPVGGARLANAYHESGLMTLNLVRNLMATQVITNSVCQAVKMICTVDSGRDRNLRSRSVPQPAEQEPDLSRRHISIRRDGG